jgi:adenylate cyclase
MAEYVLRGSTTSTFRRLPMLAILALRMLLYGSVVIIGMVGAELLLPLVGLPAPPIGTLPLSSHDILVAAGIALALNIVFLLRAVLGPGVLPSLLIGRYNRPRRQERIVLFLDLVGSTRLAERLGDAEFLRFLNFVFYDLSGPVLETRGEVYRYVGDEMIVSWPLRRGVRNAACIACLFAMDAALAERAPDYLRRFGAQPRVRGALHAGPLIIGEMGDVKREIVLLGDTMNTAARIEEACRTTGHDYIASGAVVRALDALPAGITAIDLGVTALRGKAGSLELFALQRTSSGVEAAPPLNTPRARTVQRPVASGSGQTAEPVRSTGFAE